MTDNEIVKALDGADVFLRDRATSIPAPLNEYDIMELLEIANVCNEATSIINNQKAEIERLKMELIEQQLKNNMLYETAKEIKAEAIKEFAEILKRRNRFYCTNVKDVAEMDFVIDNLKKELTGE